MTTDSAALSTLAQELLAYAIDNSVSPVASPTAADDTGSVVVTGLDYGYYLLNPLGGSVPAGSFATMFSLNTLSGADTEITVKSEYPTIDKVIVDGGDVKATDASIDDTLTFKLTSKVPDTTGYNYYYFLVEDTLSSGLTYDSFGSITIGGVTVPSTDYTVEAPAGAGGMLRIFFDDFQAAVTTAGASVGDSIVITYDVVLNEDANIGTANPNEVDLTYSNDPKYDYDGTVDPSNPGDPENPGSGTPPTGTTPKSITETFTTSLTINKVDEVGDALIGASFKIEGTSINTVLVTTYSYALDAGGSYWKLKDGTYTTDAPDVGTEHLYDSTTDKYEQTVTTVDNSSTQAVSAQGAVGEDGILVFTGLGAGEYTITEIVTPDGYNDIDPITVTISFDGTTKLFSVGATDPATVSGNNVFMEIQNLTGPLLPSTGGIGTTVFYVVGGILLLGAVVLLVTKRRINCGK